MDKFTNFDFSISFIKCYTSLNNLLESRIQQNLNLLILSSAKNYDLHSTENFLGVGNIILQ